MDKGQTVQKLTQLRISHPQQFTQLANFLLSSGEAWVLLWIKAQDKDVFAIDITEHFGLTPGRVANIIKKLEERGYIERLPFVWDLRKSRICLTEAGLSHTEKLLNKLTESHTRFIESLDEQDSFQTIQILQKILSLLENGMLLDIVK